MIRYSVRRRRRAIERAEKALKQLAGNAEIHIEFVLEDNAAEVTAVKYYGKEIAGYPLCPRCGFGVEREYQNFCEVCGQRLLWKQFAKGNVTVKRLMGME